MEEEAGRLASPMEVTSLAAPAALGLLEMHWEKVTEKVRSQRRGSPG